MGNTFTDFSEAVTGLVDQAAPGVVRVEARRRLPASGIVWSADGLILTAHHVVQAEKANIGLEGGTAVSATLLGRDPSTDLALLRAETHDLAPLPLAATEEVAVGNIVLALARPGQTVQATLGIVSAWEHSWRTQGGGQIDQYLQTDVAMYPGFSGGALVNANGQLIGLNTSGFGQGVSLAIPTATLRRVAGALLAHGRIKRGYLGVSTQRVRLPEATQAELGQKSGLLIIAVEPDSPAAKGGLALGDTIVALDGEMVRKHEQLFALLSGDRVGTAVPVTILRGGKVETLSVTIGERT